MYYRRYHVCMTNPLNFEVVAFFPADHADTANGKAYINGGFWNRVAFPVYPAALPPISLVAVVRVPFAKYQAEHTFVMGMVDPDGRQLPFRAEGKFRVGASPMMEYGDPSILPVCVPVVNLLLERPGEYAFTFTIGEELARYSVWAMQVGEPMQFNIPQSPPPPEAQAS
jgi:hypothetical protein